MGPFFSRRRRSKRSRVMDADGLLEMFHCPYEGCSQVYVALSSFQVRPPSKWLGGACFCVQLPILWGLSSMSVEGPSTCHRADFSCFSQTLPQPWSTKCLLATFSSHSPGYPSCLFKLPKSLSLHAPGSSLVPAW